MGQLLAGPFASVLLAWFGADVIKVEPPDGGDPLRTWRTMYKGTALWWYILGRNKRCVTINLRKPEGRDLVKRLVGTATWCWRIFARAAWRSGASGTRTCKAINPR